MKNFKEKLLNFFRNIYGLDQLNIFIICLSVVCVILSSIFESPVFGLINLVLQILWFCRFFSRNYVLRSNENRKFLSIFTKIKNKFDLEKKKFSERKTHAYRKCPHCKANLRLPRKKGKHTVKCPKCAEHFEVKI